LGGVVAHTDFQKLLLLYTHDWQTELRWTPLVGQVGCSF
jgi:hypothetical protein